MERYIGTKIIMAKPKLAAGVHVRDHDGEMGMLVQYKDGHISWSPQKAFDESYRKCDSMNFGLAVEAMKKGHKVARKGWNGKGIFIELQVPDINSKMTHPYIYIDTTGLQTDNEAAPKNLVPWLASQTDILSDDWVIVE